MKRRNFLTSLLAIPLIAKSIGAFSNASKPSFLERCKRGNFNIDSNSGRIFFKEDNKGPWLVDLAPTAGGYYTASIDDSYKPSVGSKPQPNSMIVYRHSHRGGHSTNPICAHYVKTSRDMDSVYDDFLKALLFFDIRFARYGYYHDSFRKYLQAVGEAHRLVLIQKKRSSTYAIIKDDAGILPDRKIRLS